MVSRESCTSVPAREESSPCLPGLAHQGHEVPQARKVWGCDEQFLAQGWDCQGVPLLQPMLCAVPKLPEESELGRAPCGIMAGVLSGMAVGCSELTSAEGSVPSPGVLSLELVLPQQQVLNALVEEL